MNPLTMEEFFLMAEMIQDHLRISADRTWTTEVCRLKFASLKGMFPEVSRDHFFWACEMWVQRQKPGDFLRFPTWAELMAPLYRCSDGAPRRDWGFRNDLPECLAPQPWQIQLLPKEPLALAPAAENAAAYVPAPRRLDAGPMVRGGVAEGGVMGYVRKQRQDQQRLEEGLLRGIWSVSTGPAGVVPSAAFLERHPQFNDPNHRETAAWEAQSASNEGLAEATRKAMRAASRCIKAP